MCLECVSYTRDDQPIVVCAMFLMTTGYVASWVALGLPSAQVTPSTPRKVLPRAGSQCGVGETSLKNVARLPESALAPLQSDHSCLEFQPYLQKQLHCEVQGGAEAGRPLPASKWLSEAML